LIGRVGVIEQLAQGGDGHESPTTRAAGGDPCRALLFQAVQLVGELVIKLESDVGDVEQVDLGVLGQPLWWTYLAGQACPRGEGDLEL
jgi:hypothetical protein